MMQTNNIPYNKTCDEHPSDCIFRFAEYRQGETFDHGYEDAHYIVYCSRGMTRLTSNLFSEEIIYGGEILFLPRMADCRGEVMDDSHAIIHTFNNSVCTPENCILSYLYRHNCKDEHRHPAGYCCKLPSHKALDLFMDGVSVYLTDETASVQLWRMKHRELIYLLCHYYRPYDLRAFFHPMTNEAVPFKSLVLAHYRKVHCAEELARFCGYSLTSFRRIFKKEFEKPVYQWLIQKRAELISYRLSMKYIPFTEIIDEFNFSSPQHFNSFCKQYLGDTPGNLRKNS